MSTHNIDFYEDLTKIIFELSSNIIKYAPYFFCCIWLNKSFQLCDFIRKHAFAVCRPQRHRSAAHQCRLIRAFGTVDSVMFSENLIFANICKFDASQNQSSHLY